MDTVTNKPRPRKPGGGRKPDGEIARSVIVHIRLTPDAAQSAEAWARQEGIAVAELMRRALDAWITEKQFV